MGRFLIVAAVMLFSLICISEFYWRRHPQIDFNRSTWKSAEGGVRRTMIRDLVTNVLPGLSRPEMEALLGDSPTNAESIAAAPDYIQGETSEEKRQRRVQAGLDPNAYYFEDYAYIDFDLAYMIGRRPTTPLVTFLSYALLDPNIGEHDPDLLFIRLGPDGKFESWYSFGFDGTPWPNIVGPPGNETYREKR